MKKILITTIVALSIFGGEGMLHQNNVNNIAAAKTTLSKEFTYYANNYKTTPLKYQQSVRGYQIKQQKAKFIGYATLNQDAINPSKTKTIKQTKYIYVSPFNAWIKAAAYQNFQTELKHFKAQYQKYQDEQASQNQSNTSNNSTQTTTTPSIVNDDNFKAAYRAAALAEINQLRASVGVTPLTEDATLDKIADVRANQNMARGDGSISHYDSNGNVLNVSAAAQVGLTEPLAENIAMRSLSDDASRNATDIAKAITHQYIDEGPENKDGKEHGHYENLVSPNVTTIGISFAITTTPDSKGYIYMYDAEELSASSSSEINANIINNLNNH